jgi:hypothetical protein
MNIEATLPLLVPLLTGAENAIDPRTLVARLLAGHVGSDPSLSALFPLVAEGRPSIGESAQRDDEVRSGYAEDARRFTAILVPAAAEAMAHALQHERQELLHRNARLASALGACALCWGDDESCASCGGQGSPGSTAVDVSLFEQFVAPAVACQAEHTSPPDRSFRRTTGGR